MEKLQELRREGLSISGISELTGFSRHTIRKYLLDPRTPVYGPRVPRPSKLDPYKSYIAGRLEKGVWNAVVLLPELRARGYTGGYSTLRAYLSPLRKAARAAAVRRFETAAGEQAQVDWGYLGEVIVDGESRSLWGFVLTLGHSRAMFVDIATEQSLGVFLRMHEAAFEFLGGVPAEILYDRVKTVQASMTERGEVLFCPTFSDFAGYYGFTPRLCRAYRPQTKGKVESGVGYVKKNFLCGRTASSLDDLRGQLREWIVTVAHRRVHGTTHQVVEEAWRAEREHLSPLAGRPAYPYLPEHTRRVASDAYVEFRTNRYSVPWETVGRQVAVREHPDRVEIVLDGCVIAAHAVLLGRYQISTDPAHHAQMPYGPSGPSRRGKPRIVVVAGAPEVEVRPLAAYELVGVDGGGGIEC